MSFQKAIPPHTVIDRQLEAYRQRNVETFASFYSTDIKGYRNGEPSISGIEDLRAKYRELFDLSPDLSIEIPDRKIENPYVYDTELITGLRGNPKPIVAHVRYKVENSKIVEVHITL